MNVPTWLRRLFTVDDSVIGDQFELNPEASQADESTSSSEADEPPSDDVRSTSETMETIRPIPLKRYVQQSERRAEAEHVPDTNHIPFAMSAVHARLKQTFHLSVNKDIVVREFTVGVRQKWNAIAVFIDGMASTGVINTHILEPLMVLADEDDSGESDTHDHLSGERGEGLVPSLQHRMETVVRTLLPSNQISVMNQWEEVTNGILTGSTAVFVEGTERAVIAETKGWEHRSVSRPQVENVVKGPNQAFTENFRTNTALVRSLLRSNDLITEMLSVGRLGKTDVAVMYMHGLTNKRLVAEVKRRIQVIDIDYLADVGTLQQFIEDNPRVWLPQSLSTERPDRVAQMLTDGHVAIFVGQSSFVLMVPMVFWTLMQSAEDSYLRWPFGAYLRMIRWVAVFAALLTPALYVSVTNYHPEMIPTDLMMAIAGSREQVPFPVIVEILMMELAIELIREAGIRIPSVIGPTIGIVGALIIGQAAVQAGIVSPLLVIVIALTALASFTIPTYNLQFGVRIMRFVFLMVSAMFGFYGMTLVIVAMIARLSVQKSFGVPLFAPVAPKVDSARDALTRGPAYVMNKRPLFLYPQKIWKQDPYNRPWSGTAQRSQSRIDAKQSGKSGSEQTSGKSSGKSSSDREGKGKQ